jgi:sugar phosphate isomerase/epimerase
MKLSISNIAWNSDDNEIVYDYLNKKKYDAIEIAPTKFINEKPYDDLDKIALIVNEIEKRFGLKISSMQSIWYGQKGNIFVKENQEELINYTKKAILYASKINCGNLVFGCPKNRNMNDNNKIEYAFDFFRTIGDYACNHDTVVALEPNPKIYGTNFINYTKDAFDFVKGIQSNGLKVNMDFGTIIENNESLDIINDNIELISHIHISEPYLELIKEREEHKQLANILRKKNYDKYVSIEMKEQKIEDVFKTIDYVYEIFH